MAQRFFAEVNRQSKKFMSDEHFTVDGTLLQAGASQKSYRSKDGSGKGDGSDFHGQTRSNDTHQSTNDPDAALLMLDRRTTRHKGYAISLSRRWLVEKSFGWLKQTGPLRQVKLRGLEKVDWLFLFSCAAYNLPRLPNLMAKQTQAQLRPQCA